MWPVETGKCLIPFLGKPLLFHNLKKIKETINGEYVIVASPDSRDGVEDVAKELGLSYKIVIQKKPAGMADALLCAKDLVDGEILVINAEDILEPSVFQNKFEGDVALTGLKVKKYFDGGYLKVEGERVKGIVEKPGEGNEPSDMIKLVVDYYKDGKKLIEYIEKVSDPERSRRDDVYEVALSQMISDGMDVKFAKYDGVWIPLKYPWHILDITAHFLGSIDQKIYPGKVIIEDGVKVFEGALIKGPCYIGKNCIVGNYSMVREANLEEGCVTGFSSDITRSYVGVNSWFHTNYIGDSILEGDFGAGSGAVLANLRLDNRSIRSGEIDTGRSKLGLIAGKGVRVGANVSTMPGVKIGAGSLVGPGVVLKKDLKENKKIVIKKEEAYEIQDHSALPTAYDQFRDKLK